MGLNAAGSYASRWRRRQGLALMNSMTRRSEKSLTWSWLTMAQMPSEGSSSMKVARMQMSMAVLPI